MHLLLQRYKKISNESAFVRKYYKIIWIISQFFVSLLTNRFLCIKKIVIDLWQKKKQN